MALVAAKGRPDFLITTTANPQWAGITSNLRPGESAADRPDLAANVFHEKLKILMRMSIKKHILGRVSACTWVVEFQRRDPPHVYLLLIPCADDKPTARADVDNLVSAEIPDPKA